MSGLGKVVVVVLAVVLAAVLGALAGGLLGAAYAGIVMPGGGLEALGPMIGGFFVGAAAGAFIELVALFKWPRLDVTRTRAMVVGMLVATGLAGLVVGLTTDGGMLPFVLMPWLPLGLLPLLAAGTQRLIRVPARAQVPEDG